MMQITPQMRIILAVEPVDFRKGIDGLAAICRRVLKNDPFSGYADLVTRGDFAPRFLDTLLFEGRISDLKLE